MKALGEYHVPGEYEERWKLREDGQLISCGPFELVRFGTLFIDGILVDDIDSVEAAKLFDAVVLRKRAPLLKKAKEIALDWRIADTAERSKERP